MKGAWLSNARQPPNLSPQPTRRVGLSRYQTVQPLLVIPTKQAGNLPPQKAVNKPLVKLAMVNDSDSPVSSSSEDDGCSRADINRQTLTSINRPPSPSPVDSRPKRQVAHRRPTRSAKASQSTSSASKNYSDEKEDDAPPKSFQNSRKRGPSEDRDLGAHLQYDQVLDRRKFQAQSYKRHTYGSSKPKTMSLPRDVTKKESVSPKKKGLMRLDDLSKAETTPSPDKPRLNVPVHNTLSPGSPLKKRPKKSLDRVKPTGSPEESQRPSFIIPEMYSSSFKMEEDDNDDGLEITGMSTLDHFSSRSLSPLSDTESPKSSPSICPCCNEEVGERMFDAFRNKYPGTKPTLTLRQEQAFCTFHKRRAARNVWRKKKYPDIRWKKLDKRIARQHSFLRAILEGGESHYGNIYSQKVKGGQNKTLLKSDSSLTITPGYYGTRGFQAMSDNLIRKFAPLLRERAVQDRLISARGYTTYVHAVLVPELAVQLIKDDMGVGEEKARSIMEESIAVGELLHEEVKDVVLESGSESGAENSTASGGSGNVFDDSA